MTRHLVTGKSSSSTAFAASDWELCRKVGSTKGQSPHALHRMLGRVGMKLTEFILIFTTLEFKFIHYTRANFYHEHQQKAQSDSHTGLIDLLLVTYVFLFTILNATIPPMTILLDIIRRSLLRIAPTSISDIADASLQTPLHNRVTDMNLSTVTLVCLCISSRRSPFSE